MVFLMLRSEEPESEGSQSEDSESELESKLEESQGVTRGLGTMPKRHFPNFLKHNTQETLGAI